METAIWNPLLTGTSEALGKEVGGSFTLMLGDACPRVHEESHNQPIETCVWY